MEFRRAKEKDIADIMKIIMQAQNYLKKQGIDQWQNGYPNEETIKMDILRKNAYVLVQENIIIGTVAVLFEKEENYEKIYEGDWMGKGEYATIHRLAIESKHKGLGFSSIMIRQIERMAFKKGMKSIRVDTHRQNLSMQRLLEKEKFTYCGIIYLKDGDERMAFEKIL
ncbi:GNAT family N-acetyltransferase [Garciella nitratireducens]|uniref:Acetyltransferase (GNAT) domain-containing protein n=1 Tax=Garciella nitratireducens DSM 15102 TaxID=1121911 RepID=A0A1T4MTD6_9FIRM|nr:GNAT family N-acetyltransferase [Garciella nitratireducens]RBP44957.1 acetyltransferase (GNAT) family protein [Garciella nitratireducens]SJZ70233.1 Acetyltransferase (GNAT) domain-containing protein [Garciella nitratireducens DSM 15102]